MDSVDQSRIDRHTPRQRLRVDDAPSTLERLARRELVPPRQALTRAAVVPLNLLRVPRRARHKHELCLGATTRRRRARAVGVEDRPRREDGRHVVDVVGRRRAPVTRLVRTRRDDDVSELRHVLAVERCLEERIPASARIVSSARPTHDERVKKAHQRNS